MATKRERCYSTQTEGRTVEVASFTRGGLMPEMVSWDSFDGALKGCPETALLAPPPPPPPPLSPSLQKRRCALTWIYKGGGLPWAME